MIYIMNTSIGSASSTSNKTRYGSNGIVTFSDDGLIATKCINKINANSNNEIDFSTYREICFLKQFYKLKNIPIVDNFVEYQDKFVIQMNNCGITLYEYIQHYNYTIRMQNFNFIFINIIKVLIQLHENNILHGDLKCTNICFNPETMLISLVDFGSVSIKTFNKYEKSLYTYDHSAPELLLNNTITEQSEIWSLGIIMITYIFKDILTHRYIDIKSKSTIKQDLINVYKDIQNGERSWITSDSLIQLNNNKKLQNLLIDMLSFDPGKRPKLRYILSNYFGENNIENSINLQFRYKKNINLFDNTIITILDRKEQIELIYYVLSQYDSLHLLVFIIELLDNILNYISNITLDEYKKYAATCTHMTLNYIYQTKAFLHEPVFDIFGIYCDTEYVNNLEFNIFKIMKYKMIFDTFDKYIKESNINYLSIMNTILPYDNVCNNNDFMLKKYYGYNNIS